MMTKKTIIIIAVYAVLLLVLGAIVVRRRSQPQITVAEEIIEIRLEDGDNSISVNRHGQVTIRTADKTIMQYWNPDRVKELFAKMADIQANNCLTEGEYVLIINLADSQQNCRFSGYDVLSLTGIQELLTIMDNIVAIDMPMPTVTISTASRFVYPTATPTPVRFVYPTATPTPVSDSGQTGSNLQEPFQCAFSEPGEDDDNSFVISETVCSELLD